MGGGGIRFTRGRINAAGQDRALVQGLSKPVDEVSPAAQARSEIDVKHCPNYGSELKIIKRARARAEGAGCA